LTQSHNAHGSAHGQVLNTASGKASWYFLHIEAVAANEKL